MNNITKRPVSAKPVFVYLKDYKPKINEAIALVSSFVGVSEEEIKAPARGKDIDRAKHLVRYLLYQFTETPLDIIALNTAIVSHSTVIASNRNVINWKTVYQKDKEQIEQLEKIFNGTDNERAVPSDGTSVSCNEKIDA